VIKLPSGLKVFLLITDIGFLLYWGISALVALDALNISGEYLFDDYYDPVIFAWNWSFMPLDIVLSVLGLVSLKFLARGQALGRTLLIMSMTLTMCAGLMALSFWAIRMEFDVVWWSANFFLLVWPLLYFPSVIRMERSSA